MPMVKIATLCMHSADIKCTELSKAAINAKKSCLLKYASNYVTVRTNLLLISTLSCKL